VVDDGSTDGTAAIVGSYPEMHYIYQRNQGPVAARNMGLANCNGELISFLDADDYWPPNKLEAQSAYLEAHPEQGCVIGKVWNFLENGMSIPHWISESMLTEAGGGWNLGASLTHRWVFDRIGHFNINYPFGDDLEWAIRLSEADIPFSLVPEVFLHRRIHAGNISRDQNTMAQERVRIVKAHMDRERSMVVKPLRGDF